MALNIFSKLSRCPINKVLKNARFYGLWEPDYLDIEKPEFPMYPVMNVRIRSYEFPVLEKYQHHIHKVANNLGVDVEDSWCFPATCLKIRTFKKSTTAVEAEYHLNMYERDTQVSNLSSLTAPLFLRLLEASLPEGVKLDISEYDPAIELKRYVPDKELLDLKAELEEMQKEKK